MSADVITEVDGRRLVLSNLDKVLYPATGWTKAEVIAYYAGIAPVLLPHLRGRVVSRLRFPDGVPADAPTGADGGTTPSAAGSFWEKNAPVATPSWVGRQRVGTSDGVIDYVVVREPATLVWLANLAALELHVPQWTLDQAAPDVPVVDLPTDEARPDEPLADRVVVDLDPGAGTTLVDTARAALLVAAVMASDGLLPVPQSSGSKGIQVLAAVAPCRCRETWAYARHLNVEMARRHPDLFVASMVVAQRRGRVYLDHNQNLAARNTIAPYSLRGRARPSVATPVTWEEVAAVAGPDDLRFGPDAVVARVAEVGDLAAELLVDDRPPVPAP